MIKNRKRKSRAVRKSLSDRTAVSDSWNPVWDGLISGIAFDQKGMHVTIAWPDGEPTYWLVRWNDVSLDLFRKSSLFWKVYDYHIIHDESVKLTRSQQNRKQAMVEAIFALPEKSPLRVQVSTKVSKAIIDGRKRSIQAASRGFEKKLGWLRTLHRKTCWQLAAGRRSSSKPEVRWG